jgi:hypothetical protein
MHTLCVVALCVVGALAASSPPTLMAATDEDVAYLYELTGGGSVPLFAAYRDDSGGGTVPQYVASSIADQVRDVQNSFRSVGYEQTGMDVAQLRSAAVADRASATLAHAVGAGRRSLLVRGAGSLSSCGQARAHHWFGPSNVRGLCAGLPRARGRCVGVQHPCHLVRQRQCHGRATAALRDAVAAAQLWRSLRRLSQHFLHRA